jgi:hypothetical protein
MAKLKAALRNLRSIISSHNVFMCFASLSQQSELNFPSTSLQWECNVFLPVQMGFVVVKVTMGKCFKISFCSSVSDAT